MLKRSPHSRKPPRPETIEETVAAYDTAARDAAWRWGEHVFDHTLSTIEPLEGILDEIHKHLHEPSFRRRIGLGPSESDIQQWANLWGIYIGETLRAELGGSWMMGHEEAPNLLALAFDDGTVAFPTARVFRRLTDGASENVVEYTRMIIDAVRGAASEAPPQSEADRQP
jgi:hypothetical protein